ncbi:MAG: SRPBCC family protein [Ornithinibacter sp.]
MTHTRISAQPVTRTIEAGMDAVWAVLANGWAYPTWVVGASRVRAVDAGWPAEGARIHHSFGVWPAVVDDTTEVIARDTERELVLKARGWPMGEAEVVIGLVEVDEQRCIVSIAEDAVSGPGTLVPKAFRQPPIRRRNVESLKRLAYLAERHTGDDPPTS